MGLHKFTLVLMLQLFLLIGTFVAFAQDRPAWKVGDQVEVEDIYTQKWEKAKITQVTSYGYYKARLDNPPPNTETELLLRPDQVRARSAATTPIGKGTSQPTHVGNGRSEAASSIQFKVGDRVIEFDRQNKSYAYRATVLEVGNGRYKIQRDGCTRYEMWVDQANLHAARSLSASAPEISYLIGKWAMFQPGAANTVVRGNDVYREYGPGGKADYLQINRDGTYEWQYESRAAPVGGRWRTEPKLEEAPVKASESLKKSEDYDGIVIEDPEGREWKVYKYVIPGKGKDSVVAARICQEGNREIGTRVQ